MNLKDICIDLKIAKQLKEKGFKQDSLLYWHYTNYKKWSIFTKPYAIDSDKKLEDGFISAPTAEEILKELPKNFDKKYLGIAPSLNNNAYGVYYMKSDQSIEVMKESGKLCNALAKMWLFLKDNNLLKED